MIPLRLNETANLSFTVMLEGTHEIPDSRLVFTLREGQEFSIAGIYNDGVVQVAVPSMRPLENLLETDIVEARLEVLVDGRYFVPWRDSFQLETPVGVETDLLNESDLQREDAQVQASVGSVTVNTKEAESVQTRLRRKLGKK